MKKYSFIKILALIILLIVTIFATIFVIKLKENQSIQEKEENMYQYFFGKKVEYRKVEILRENDRPILKSESNTTHLDSTPVYYTEKQKVIFPEYMAIVYPLSNGIMYKTQYFSTLHIDDQINKPYLMSNNKEKALENTFFFDGNDLYFFVEPVKIEIENKKIEISPLSYAIVTYGGNVEIYNKEKDEYIIIENVEEDVIAYADKYTINLSIDALKYSDTEQLLIKRIDYLKKLEI